MNILSLFANIGVAEAYLNEIGFHVAVANELIEKRANLYSKIYPETEMICGDINDLKVLKRIVNSSVNKKVDIIMATPPCQGMSTAGLQKEDDERNKLIFPVISIINKILPKYVFIENVPLFLRTKVEYEGIKMLIPEILEQELGERYIIKMFVINTDEYSVPQTRERAILLMTRRNLAKVWMVPNKDEKKVTMRDVIGHLPSIDPYVTDVDDKERHIMFPDYDKKFEEALKISPWNKPPHHIKRQVVAMMHTPSGMTAFDNKKYYPIKKNGAPVKGYKNTYKRQNWDTPAYTVTMDNRKISSQNNVHPGRYLGEDGEGDMLYSDPRTLTLYELMKIMSIPENWPVPIETSEAFLRRVIGEGIPPLFVKKVFEELLK